MEKMYDIVDQYLPNIAKTLDLTYPQQAVLGVILRKMGSEIVEVYERTMARGRLNNVADSIT